MRPGEKLIRNWSNKGLWANMDDPKMHEPGSLKGVVGQGSLRYSPKWGDLSAGRIGNGTLEYDVPLAEAIFVKSALTADNVAAKGQDQQSPALHVKDGGKPAVLDIRMPSGYVYLTGQAELKAVVGAGGEIKVLFSDNNGSDFKELTTITASGEQKLDLNKLVRRKYDYRLRFAMKGNGTGLDGLKITHDIEQSQRALPALGEGSNTIHFSAGPNEETITYEASGYARNKGKVLTYEDLHAKVTNNGESDASQGRLMHNGGQATTVDFPVTTPQEMKRLRIFGFWQTGSPKSTVWNVQVSFDQGKTFQPYTSVDNVETRFNQIVVTVDKIPAGTKSVIVRYVGTGDNTGILLNYRMDADYCEAASGFRPVKVTYAWDEGGTEKTDVHVAAKPDEKYTINCKTKPTMKSVTMELAN